MSDEKRSFSRVNTHFKANVRPLRGAAALPSFNGCPGCYATSVDMEALKQANVPSALAEYLGAINDKLDMLISMLSRDDILEDFPLEVEVVEISGSGMRFICREELSLDQHVEIVMMLSRMPLRMAGAIGRITRTEKLENGEIRYGLDFTSIRDADLETVVQFVFKEQRARIREQKWS
ncbi:MAG: PilZ domain-containing protein [Desulfovibrio sp.]|uniref:PilZ domain-containing protein n=1 Tax=Desulfovibrio sp. 7SRBS1 TaxID=3378064 RepID=UPI003B3D24C0